MPETVIDEFEFYLDLIMCELQEVSVKELKIILAFIRG